jgi:hypothetical protein
MHFPLLIPTPQPMLLLCHSPLLLAAPSLTYSLLPPFQNIRLSSIAYIHIDVSNTRKSYIMKQRKYSIVGKVESALTCILLPVTRKHHVCAS